MDQFDLNCLNYAELTTCSYAIQQKLKIDAIALYACVKNSYVPADGDILTSDNILLKH